MDFPYGPGFGLRASSCSVQGSAAIRAALHSNSPDLGAKLQLWSAVVEEAVSSSMRDLSAKDSTALPCTSLPRSFRGRCVPESSSTGRHATSSGHYFGSGQATSPPAVPHAQCAGISTAGMDRHTEGFRISSTLCAVVAPVALCPLGPLDETLPSFPAGSLAVDAT